MLLLHIALGAGITNTHNTDQQLPEGPLVESAYQDQSVAGCDARQLQAQEWLLWHGLLRTTGTCCGHCHQLHPPPPPPPPPHPGQTAPPGSGEREGAGDSTWEE